MAHPRIIAVVGCTALLMGLFWLDGNRTGPVSGMFRCNLMLSRASEPAADILLLGSSRTGVALDPIAMEAVLGEASGRQKSIDRLSLGAAAYSPLRAMSGLLENYLAARGAPKIAVLEIMFITQRSPNRLAQLGIELAPGDYNYQRDVQLLRYGQLLSQPSVAMPFTRKEGAFSLWSYRLKGVIMRSGALLYQALRGPNENLALSTCTRNDWRRAANWPTDFVFSYGEFELASDLANQIEALEMEVALQSEAREVQERQVAFGEGLHYPYDFESDYRQGEVRILETMVDRLLEQGAEVMLLPLPLYGYKLDHAELLDFTSRFPGRVKVFDLYGEINANIDPLWYDDAHVERFPVGKLTTALMARRLLESPALSRPSSRPDD